MCSVVALAEDSGTFEVVVLRQLRYYYSHMDDPVVRPHHYLKASSLLAGHLDWVAILCFDSFHSYFLEFDATAALTVSN